MIKFLWMISMCIVAFFILEPAESAQDENRWTFEFNQCTFSEAITRISKTTGIQIKLETENSNPILINRSYHDVNFEMILKDLLKKQNHFVLWRFVDGKLFEIDISILQNQNYEGNALSQYEPLRSHNGTPPKQSKIGSFNPDNTLHEKTRNSVVQDQRTRISETENRIGNLPLIADKSPGKVIAAKNTKALILYKKRRNTLPQVSIPVVEEIVGDTIGRDNRSIIPPMTPEEESETEQTNNIVPVGTDIEQTISNEDVRLEMPPMPPGFYENY